MAEKAAHRQRGRKRMQTMAARDWAGRGRRALAAAAVAAVAIVVAQPAAASEVQFGAAPDWVHSVAPPLQVQAEPGTTSGGVQYLLSDEQTRIEAHDRVRYRHYVTRALTGDGVEDVAHVEVGFDPSYETLTLHAVNVYRAGHRLSRLNPASVRVLQREKDLEARIYDGRKTANVMLDDVRIGDVVEYDYTLRGANPAYRERSFGGFDLQWKVPLQSLYARLLVPEGREPRITPRNTALQPEVQHHDGWVDYVWQAGAVPALPVDNDAPDWYDPYASVQWSEYADWGAVAAWALPLYRAAPDQGPALQAQVDAIAHASADPAERLLATLHFVQREVRYLGIEVGIGSLAPRAPHEVLEHRFGDCKDKALLTVWMLRALGIDAQPALVNTRLERAIEQYSPSPGLFDHVVVRARIAGRDYWLDPTRAVQKGTLANLSQADFGRALVIDAATTGLQAMVDRREVIRKRDVHTVFDASGGRGKPMTMQVTTVYQGESAESMRAHLAGRSRDTVQHDYLNFYANYYPGVTLDKPFTVSDDDANNRLTISEYYRLGDLWKRSDPDKRFELSIQSPEIDSELHAPESTVRSGPLALLYPFMVTSVTEIRLHKDWNLDIAPGAVEDPAFRFSYDTSTAGSVVKMTERLEFRADQVPADRVAAYVTQVKRARDTLGIGLYLPDHAAKAATGGFNWLVALLGLCMFGGALWLARQLHRYDPPPRAGDFADAPRGIAGWLLLPALGLIVKPLLLARAFWSILPVYSNDVWSTLTVAGGASYNPAWAPMLLCGLGMNVLLIVFAVMLALLFFRKRSSVPHAYAAFLWVSVAFTVIDQLTAQAVAPKDPAAASEWASVIRDVLSALIWGSYFLVSRRVAATFVQRLRHPSEVVGEPADVGVVPVEAVAPGA
jgi:transglutaminase-like putative cysteine protease